MLHALEKCEMHTGVWCGNPKGIRRLAKLCVEENVILSLSWRNSMIWNELTWLRIGTGGGLLRMWS
jgi:hypothetical protein